MYHGNARSWNLRDTHMVETLASLFSFHGSEARGVVWEHNSHVGDARATEMKLLGEHNVGELCRERWGEGVYIIGFGTDHGTVAAAPNWGDPMEVMNIVPGRAGSYERLFHETALPSFTLPLRQPRRLAVREELLSPLLERAIGVIYRPQTEFQSHYFSASLPRQFDEYIWFDGSHAVTPLAGSSRAFSGELPDTYPFGV
jgi:protein-L-isoaspartate(D-aspartate) O-methyltransferase